MRLLEAHGITLIPEETAGSGALETAMRSGQALTLTEAGRMALSSSSTSKSVPTIVKTTIRPQSTTAAVQKPTIVKLSTGVNAGGPGGASTIPVIRTSGGGAQSPIKAIVRGNATGAATASTTVLPSGAKVIRTQVVSTGGGKAPPKVIKISPAQFQALKTGTTLNSSRVLVGPFHPRLNISP